MMFKKKRMDKVLDRLDALLGALALQEKSKRLPKEAAEAIVCNDGVVLLNLSKDGYAISMIKDVVKIDFNLALTAAEMQEFNEGGKGLKERFFSYDVEGTQWKE